MAKRIYSSTPKQDGFRMPGEFEPQAHVFMVWPQRTDNWRQGAKPAQRAFTEVAKAIAKHTNVTMLVNNDQYANARARLPRRLRHDGMRAPAETGNGVTDSTFCRSRRVVSR